MAVVAAPLSLPSILLPAQWDRAQKGRTQDVLGSTGCWPEAPVPHPCFGQGKRFVPSDLVPGCCCFLCNFKFQRPVIVSAQGVTELSRFWEFR